MKLDDARQFELQGRYLDAEKIFRALVINNPNDGQAYWGLGRLALKAEMPERAIAYLKNACQLLPDEPKPLIHLATAFNGALSEQDALTVLQYGARKMPNVAQMHYELGQQQLIMGRLFDAENSFRQVLQAGGTKTANLLRASAFLEIAHLKKVDIKDPELIILTERLASASITEQEEVVIHYGLAKVLNDNGDFDSAWQHYQKANALQLKKCEFKTSELKQFFQNIKSKNNEGSLSNKRLLVNQELSPVFILGLPRTGSSLLEYILSKHPDISGAGELPYIGQQVANYLYSQTKKHYPDFVPIVNSGQMDEAAKVYLALLARHAKGNNFVVDKLPANFQSIGLIYKLFPNAKVIHLSRDMPATALSVFTNYFAENEPYFCSLEEFKQYAELHDDLMRHWHSHLPGFVHEVKYEQLVESPKESIQSILNFCGLAWSEACLAHSDIDVSVKTLSKVQVRQPITKGASGAWKNYQKHLELFVSNGVDEK